jgi:hypothetical protein
VVALEEYRSSSLAAGQRRRKSAGASLTSTPKNRVWGFANTPSGRPCANLDLSWETAIGSVQYTYKIASGRAEFLSRDPLGFKAGPNMYTYVQQNPWTHFDPEGLDLHALHEFWAGMGDSFIGIGKGIAHAAMHPIATAISAATFSAQGTLHPIDRLHYIANAAVSITNATIASIQSGPRGQGQVMGNILAALAPLGSAGAAAKMGSNVLSKIGDLVASTKVENSARAVIEAPKATPKIPAPAPPPVPPNAAAGLPQMKGMGGLERDKTLSTAGFKQTKVSGPGNETWGHSDNSEVRVHPYGNAQPAPYKSANNAHLHKEDPAGNQLSDRGHISTDKNQTHIGLPNPRNLPQVRNRRHGS